MLSVTPVFFLKNKHFRNVLMSEPHFQRPNSFGQTGIGVNLIALLSPFSLYLFTFCSFTHLFFVTFIGSLFDKPLSLKCIKLKCLARN